MMKEYLQADLARQLEIEGHPERRATWPRLIARLLHPRFFPLVLCRMARAAFLRRVPILPELLTYLNIVLFGLEASPRCDIGPGLFLPHTYGTVIGACEIGKSVTIFQGVTLGAKEVDMTFKPELRPKIGNQVTIGAGAKILGGVRVGDGVIIGANAVVLNNIPPHLTVVGIPARPIALRDRSRLTQ